MSTNSLLTPSIIAAEALRMFENELSFTKRIDKQYSKEFAKTGAKIGNTITVRKPWRPTVRSGPALQTQAVNEESVPLVLSSQKGVDFVFSMADLTLTIDEFAKRYVKPAIVAVANQVDIDLLTMAYQNTYNAVGTPGTTPSGSGATGAILTYLQAQQKLNELSCPKDDERSFHINPAAEVDAVAAFSGLFQSASEISEQYRTGAMGKGLGGDWYMNQNIQNYTSGALGGTPVVSGASQTGSSLVTSGWTASVANLVSVGDVFTIGGVHKVNPITKQSTGVLQQFVVTAAASSNGSGDATISISPSIITSGSTQTVDAAPANSAALTFAAAASTLTANNLLCHKDAFTLGCADMELPEGVHFAARAQDEESGLSIRIVRAYDINSDQIPCRLDILYGSAAFRPEWACRIFG